MQHGPSALAADAAQPFLGGWDLTIPGGAAGWLGVTEKDGQLQASLLWGGGSVVPVTSAKMEGDQLVLTRVQCAGKAKTTVTSTITARAAGDALSLTISEAREGAESGAKKAVHRQAHAAAAAGPRLVESEVRRADRAL